MAVDLQRWSGEPAGWLSSWLSLRTSSPPTACRPPALGMDCALGVPPRCSPTQGTGDPAPCFCYPDPARKAARSLRLRRRRAVRLMTGPSPGTTTRALAVPRPPTITRTVLGSSKAMHSLSHLAMASGIGAFARSLTSGCRLAAMERCPRAGCHHGLALGTRRLPRHVDRLQ